MSNQTVTTFLDKCLEVVTKQPDQTFASWYNVDGDETKSYTFQELWDEAGTVAYHLRVEWQLEKGDQVILCYNFGLHFFASFLGCLRAGVVAVLVYPPAPPLTTSLTKMNKVVKQCKARLILTDKTIATLKFADGLNPLSKSHDLWPKLDFKETDRLQKMSGKSWLASSSSFFFGSEEKSSSSLLLSYDETNVLPSDLAFLQYTSGSTGDPKGVMITHGALSNNIQLIHNNFEDQVKMENFPLSDLTLCHWLPQYHDAGLIVCTAAPFAAGQRVHVLSPLDFLRRPITWLEVASRQKANWLFAPNFSYDLAARKFIERETKHTVADDSFSLDLSSLFNACSMSEPIQPQTVARFQSVFEPHGLRPDTMGTGYGLAETVVGVSILRGIVPSEQHPNLVAVGHRDTFHSANIRIVDSGKVNQVPDGVVVDSDPKQEVPDGTIGEIWLSGPSLASGYYGRPELSQQVFGAQLSSEKDQGKSFLRTGDLGFFENDYLYICGRIKDLIIVNGVNHYPQDVEFVVQEASSSVRPGCCAAFSSSDTGGDGDLEIVFEIRKAEEANVLDVCQQVRLAVVTKLSLNPSRVVAIRERSICKTTSGKIQRRATRKKLHGNLFDIVNELTNDEASTPFAIPQTISSILNVKDGLDSTEPIQDLEAGGDNLDEVLKRQKFNDVLHEFFGGPVDQDEEWEDLGLTSFSSVQLRDALTEQLLVTLPLTCFQTDRTPRQLAEYVVNHTGTPIATLSKPLETIQSQKMPWILMDILQAFGTVLHIVMFASAIIPAYHLSSELHKCLDATDTFQVGGTFYRWMWLPVAVPLWMICYTIFIILSKWIVVGRYSEGRIQAPSVAYLRWWWVDRGVHLFESWVGRFIQDTFLLLIVYRLMGAKIHPTARIDAFIREFDLVRIGRRASLKHQLRCRKFEPWSGNSGPFLRFRKITMASHCTVEGMLSPGTMVGNGSVVAKRAVVSEGGQVPEFSLAKGNPAFLDDLADSLTGNSGNLWIEESLKLLWLLVELYLFFSSLLIGQLLWLDIIPDGWRYSSLLYWPLLIVTSSLVSVLFGAILKWCFIGRLKAGQTVSQSPWIRTLHWAADYHYRVGIFLLSSLAAGSCISNMILKLYGMDVDFSSKVYLETFSPSNMDLVKVSQSFVSVSSLETQSNKGEYAKATILESSIGYDAVVCPGVTISKAVVPPLSTVTVSPEETNDPRFSQRKTGLELLKIKLATEFWYLVVIGMVWVAMIPAYELWMYFKPPSVETAALVLALCLAVQSVAWILVLYLAQQVQKGLGKDGRPLLPLYVAYLTLSWSVQYFTMLPTIWGTQWFSLVAWLLGTQLEGKSLYFGQCIYDFDQQTFEHHCITDGAIVAGHSLVYQDLTYGPNRLSGVYHEEVFQALFVGTNPPDVGPWKTIVGTIADRQQKAEKISVVVDA